MKQIKSTDLEALAIGAAVLGSGGGGDPASEKHISARQLEIHGPVQLIEVEELDPDDVVVPVAFMGAPLITIERLPSGREFFLILEEVEKYLGKKPTVIMPIEIGGSNAFTPLAMAAALGIPVLDADSMARAYPELQMTSFNVHWQSSSPTFLSDCKGSSVIINGRNNAEVEHIARHVTVALGSSAAFAFHIMTGEEAAKYAVPNTVSFALEIGRTVLNAQKESRDPVQALLQFTEGKLLGTGTISDIDQRIVDGFLRGSVSISDVETNEQIVVSYQNENLVATKGDEILATCPDIISIVDAQTGRPITSESLAYGLRASVLAIPCHGLWKTERGLSLVGPRYFGYPFDHIPFKVPS